MVEKYNISIFGLGYVGLPLAMRMSKNKENYILGYDKDEIKIKSLIDGISYVDDVSDNEIKSATKDNFVPTISSKKAILNSEYSIICVPTPVHENGTPNLSFIESALHEIAKILLIKKNKSPHYIILESTSYPTTTEVFIKNILDNYDLKLHDDYVLAFSPERVDPGNNEYPIQKIPKILGTIDKRYDDKLKKFYEDNLETNIIVATNPKTAEMTKLFENIFRQVNIALVNELAILCEKLEIDIFEVIELAKTKPFGFMAHYPGPGLGGHCIPVDPYYLSYIAKELQAKTEFIDLSNKINDYMTEHVIQLIKNALKKVNKKLNQSKLTIIGLAYKPNIKDIRNSPAIPLCKSLSQSGAIIRIVDDYVLSDPNIKIDYEIVEFDVGLRDTDALVIITNHDNINYNQLHKIIDEKIPIIDTRGVINMTNLRDIDLSLGRKNFD